jgi:hypothetical protein
MSPHQGGAVSVLWLHPSSRLSGQINSTGHIDKYDGSSNPEEFIQVYHTVIEAAGGDDRVKLNYLHMVLYGAARSWLINLPEGSIYT